MPPHIADQAHGRACLARRPGGGGGRSTICYATAPIGGAVIHEKFFLKTIYKKPKLWHNDFSLDERRLSTRPTENGRIRPAWAKPKG
jgi:hypothetical protein